MKGTSAERKQIRIGGISYSVLAAHTEEGFIAWRIFEGMTTGNDVASFVNDEVRRVVNPESFCIIDNASVNKVDDTLRALNKVFYYRILFSPRYQPRFKPIENGFSLIRKYIRKRESEGALVNMSSTDLIQESFTMFSKWGPKGGVSKNLWKYYHANHKFYVNSF